MVCIKPSRAYDQRPGMVTWKVRVPIHGKLFISTSRNMAERVFLMDDDGCSISWGPAFVSRSDVREVSHLALELALDGICLRELQGPNYKCYSIT